jgi:hypothetical protein
VENGTQQPKITLGAVILILAFLAVFGQGFGSFIAMAWPIIATEGILGFLIGVSFCVLIGLSVVKENIRLSRENIELRKAFETSFPEMLEEHDAEEFRRAIQAKTSR